MIETFCPIKITCCNAETFAAMSSEILKTQTWGLYSLAQCHVQSSSFMTIWSFSKTCDGLNHLYKKHFLSIKKCQRYNAGHKRNIKSERSTFCCHAADCPLNSMKKCSNLNQLTLIVFFLHQFSNCARKCARTVRHSNS